MSDLESCDVRVRVLRVHVAEGSIEMGVLVLVTMPCLMGPNTSASLMSIVSQNAVQGFSTKSLKGAESADVGRPVMSPLRPLA